MSACVSPRKAMSSRAATVAQDDDAGRVGQPVAAVGEASREEEVLGQDGGQAREGVERRVGGQDEDERREGLEEVEAQRARPEDRGGHLRHDGHVVAGDDGEGVGQVGDADEQDAQQDGHDRQRGGRVPGLRRLEGGHAVGDGLHAGERHRAAGEGSQEQQDGDRLDGVGRSGQRVHGLDACALEEDPIDAQRDHQQGRSHEEVRGRREDVPRLPDATQVAQRHEDDEEHAQGHGPGQQLRQRRGDLRDRRGDRHRDGQDVVDEEGAGGDQRWQPAEVLLGDGVGAAAVRVGDADLAIAGRDHRQQDGDGDGHLEAEDEGDGAGHDEDAQDLLGGVGARADGVGAEDGERLRLAEALADLLGRGQRTPEQDAPAVVLKRPRAPFSSCALGRASRAPEGV